MKAEEKAARPKMCVLKFAENMGNASKAVEEEACTATRFTSTSPRSEA